VRCCRGAGGILLKVFAPSTAESCLGAPALGSTTSVWSGLFLEFTFSLILVLAYLTRMHPGELLPHPFRVGVPDDPGGNGSAMIAAVYLAGTICLLPFTGASMNPTRIFGQQMFSNLDCDSFSNVWCVRHPQ
jgi:glycerol uptake facilitator-like aquaporin